VDYATLDCLQEDQDTKEEPKNRQVPEVLHIEPTPDKIRIRKTMKRQRRGCGVPMAEVGSVTQVPENSLHRLPM
jgi:hypothetical protein